MNAGGGEGGDEASKEGDEFQGHNHDATVSMMVVDTPPGRGPEFHRPLKEKSSTSRRAT